MDWWNDPTLLEQGGHQWSMITVWFLLWFSFIIIIELRVCLVFVCVCFGPGTEIDHIDLDPLVLKITNPCQEQKRKWFFWPRLQPLIKFVLHSSWGDGASPVPFRRHLQENHHHHHYHQHHHHHHHQHQHHHHHHTGGHLRHQHHDVNDGNLSV